MTDGYSAWRMLGGLKHLGCLAHVRRKFDEALKAQPPPGRTKEALDMIGKLHHIEAMAHKKMLPDGLTEIERIYQWRQEKSRPILVALHAWLVSNQKAVMPQSLIGKAVSYALGQWIRIYRYVDDGGYAIDNISSSATSAPSPQPARPGCSPTPCQAPTPAPSSTASC